MDAAPFMYMFSATMEWHAGGDVVIMLRRPHFIGFPASMTWILRDDIGFYWHLLGCLIVGFGVMPWGTLGVPLHRHSLLREVWGTFPVHTSPDG